MVLFIILYHSWIRNVIPYYSSIRYDSTSHLESTSSFFKYQIGLLVYLLFLLNLLFYFFSPLLDNLDLDKDCAHNHLQIPSKERMESFLDYQESSHLFLWSGEITSKAASSELSLSVWSKQRKLEHIFQCVSIHWTRVSSNLMGTILKSQSWGFPWKKDSSEL